MQLLIEYSRIKKINFSQLFINSSNVSIMTVRCLQLTLYLNRLFSMSVPSSCSNTRSKSVAKWYNCLINELVKQLILYRQQNGLLSRHCVDQLLRVSLIMFQHSTSHVIIHWQIHMVHFLLFLHQNCSLVTGSLRKLYFSVQMVVISES